MPTPEGAAHEDGTRLIAGRYRLETALGGGAMGTVWSGVDELLRRPVAVKEMRLPPGMPEDEAAELRERTLREARAIAMVTHPNVVTLYDVARENGEPFVIMELVPSQSLAGLVRAHGALGEEQLALVTDAVAAALEAAHRNGIIHRDVKPGNVLLAADGRIKLSDFGISRNIAEQTLTRTGITLGTPAYIAPEVAAGEAVTMAADLWGLGATLFAAAEGHPPYDTDDNPLATITAVVRGPVPEPGTTGPLREIITGLMVKDPAGRMPLPEVRRRVHPLMPDPEAHPFAALLDPGTPTVQVRNPPPPKRTLPQEQAEETEPDDGPPDAEPLAAEPGPLPFTPREPQRRGRPWWVRLALVLGALLLFAVAAVGGFVATRTLLGAPVLPPSGSAPTRQPIPELVRRPAIAGSAEQGRFSVPVPAEWTRFHGERAGLPTHSDVVHFVSPDGRELLSVERFEDFYREGHRTRDYLKALPEIVAGSRGTFRLLENAAVGGQDEASRPADRRLVFTTVQHPLTERSDDVVRSSTWLRLMPRNGDLWLLRVTVPVDERALGERLFDAVVSGFAPPG